MLAHASHQLFQRSRYSVGGWGFVGGGCTPTLLAPLAVAPRTRSQAPSPPAPGYCGYAPLYGRSLTLRSRGLACSFVQLPSPPAPSCRSLCLRHHSLASRYSPAGGVCSFIVCEGSKLPTSSIFCCWAVSLSQALYIPVLALCCFVVSIHQQVRKSSLQPRSCD